MYIPFWILIVALGVYFFKKGNTVAGIAVTLVGLVWGGFLHIPVLGPVVEQVKAMV